MRMPILAALLVAVPLSAAPVMAQSYQGDRDRRSDREYRNAVRENRQANREYRRQVRDWRQYRNYDYNRYERGQNTYYADQYYRDGRYYQTRRLGRNDRIYRGQNGQYYCRRNDGTTGLIVGGLAGGVLGGAIANGSSNLLGVLIGGAAGAALGQSVDRGKVTCR